ncbi:uncharacterized protein LOC121868878 isoform X1 [Homarus americanus]|uniref:uncharacterized protein LOC121868878 isoform X1 n=1 Tax=Homarus americanus TaxID=6706 RepID=UPI001C450149|nr:uncharacterized protein LOC121868878 isoform X1 [Homarus americanus]
MGTPELYEADPYQRVPRIPKRTESSKEEEQQRCKSPASDQDIIDVGGSTFYFHHERTETDPLAREEARRSVSRSDSKGKGDSEMLKKLLRKESKGVDKIKDEKRMSDGKSETKVEFMKVLGRKESRGMESEKEERDEGEFLMVKKASEGTGRAETEEEGLGDDGDEPSVGLELRVDQPRSRSVTPEHQSRVEFDDGRTNNNDSKRHSRFRLKEQLTKLDARLRKAFSSEQTAALENNSDLYADEIAVIGPDGEVKEREMEATADDKTDDYDDTEEAEEVREDYEEGEERDTLDKRSGILSVSPWISPRGTPKTSPRPTPSPIDEAKIIQQDLGVMEQNAEEGADRKSALALFDKDGNPVPPPRRKVRLSEAKQKSSKGSLNSYDSSVSQGTAGPPSDSPVEKDESSSDRRRHSHKAQGSDVTPVQTPGHLVATPANVTSPNSKGAFKTFVSHITKRGSSHALQDKLDGSFSRSRSSSISSLENISSEAIQCLAFVDSYTRKNDTQTAPTLWVGTSLGSVIQVMVSLPSQETRATTPATVSPSGTIFRLKGSVLAMSFLDCNGDLIPYQYESWKDANRERKLERTPTKSLVDNRMSPTNSAEQTWGDRQFIVIASEKVARVVALPSQNCVYKQIITEVSFVVKSEIIQIKDSVCLVCYVATGHISVFSLPSLRQLIYVDFLPLVDLRRRKVPISRIARTFCFTNYGHGMYLCSPTEIQKFTLAWFLVSVIMCAVVV